MAIEFLAVIEEFTGKRIVLGRKHSNELAPYWFWRLDGLTALPRR